MDNPGRRILTRLRHAADNLAEARAIAIEEGLECAGALHWLHEVQTQAIGALEADIETHEDPKPPRGAV